MTFYVVDEVNSFQIPVFTRSQDDIRDEFWTEVIDLDPITFAAFLDPNLMMDFILLSCKADFDLDYMNIDKFQCISVRCIYLNLQNL